MRNLSSIYRVLAVALVLGCEAPTQAPDSALKLGSGSGIQGTITLGPLCPVASHPSNCPPGRPLQAAQLKILDSDGNEMARFESAVDGTYSVDLDPGSYEVVALPLTNVAGDLSTEYARAPVPPGPLHVSVHAGNWLLIDLSYDSGIR